MKVEQQTGRNCGADGPHGDGTSGRIRDSGMAREVSLKDGKTTHTPFGDTIVFLDGHTGQLKSMVAGTLSLKPGMEPHPPHQHPEEEFMLVTEGHGEILVCGETYPVGPGSLMYSESNKLHGVKNTSAAPLRFYYFKWNV